MKILLCVASDGSLETWSTEPLPGFTLWGVHGDLCGIDIVTFKYQPPETFDREVIDEWDE